MIRLCWLPYGGRLHLAHSNGSGRWESCHRAGRRLAVDRDAERYELVELGWNDEPTGRRLASAWPFASWEPQPAPDLPLCSSCRATVERRIEHLAELLTLP